MAKRKSRPGGGSKLRPIKDYRDDEYVPYIFKIETGILHAWAMDPDLRDGDVREGLRGLMVPIKKSDQLPAFLTGETGEGQPKSLLELMILTNLKAAFEEHGPLNAEDTIGVLSTVNHSVGAWNRGMRGQEYLKYIQDFLGGMGVEARLLSEDEVKALGLDRRGESAGG